MKRKISVFVVLIMVLSLLCACKTEDAIIANKHQKNTEIKREDITLCLENLKSFNPYKETNPANLQTLNLVYESLFTYDEELRVVPLLAQSYEISDGGKKITVSLKDGVKWHNGDEFFANDVIYTINLILSSQSIYSKGIIDKAEVIDKKTVCITFIKPQINAPEKLMFPVIKSDELIGTGPFEFIGKESVDTYGFSRFEEYHGKKGETRSIRMINCPDENAVERLFDIGEADVLTCCTFDYAAFNARDDIKMYDYSKNKFLYIGVNFNNSIFQSKNTRKALLYIPDKKEISDKVMNKKVLCSDFPLNPKSFLYPEDLEYKKDNEYAQELLLKDGWIRVDGIFSKIIDESVQKFKINMLIKDTQEMNMISRVIEKNFDNFGIECDVLAKPDTEFEECVKNKEYDIFIDDINLLGSGDFSQLTDEGNIFGYLSSELEQLTQTIKTESDENRLCSLYRECCQVLLNDVQFIPLFFYKDAVLTGNYIEEDIILRLTK